MSEAPSDISSQNSIIFRLDTAYAAGQEITLSDQDNNEIFTLTSLKDFQAIVFSSSDIIDGDKYSLNIDGIQIEEATILGSITSVGEVINSRRR
jgi:hypothetical protein